LITNAAFDVPGNVEPDDQIEAGPEDGHLVGGQAEANCGGGLIHKMTLTAM